MEQKILFITPAEAGRRLSISRSKAYELIRRGELPARKFGASIRIPAEAIEEMARQTMTPGDGEREGP